MNTLYNSILLFVLVTFAFGCENDSNEIDDQQTTAQDSSLIKAGPILTETISYDQLEKIKYLHTVFEEVEDITLEERTDNFKRDRNLDQELNIWFVIAKAYIKYTKDKKLSIPVKKDVYKLLVLKSISPNEEVLQKVPLEHLPSTDRQKVLECYVQ